MTLFIGLIAVLLALIFDAFFQEEKWKKLHIPLLSLIMLGLYLHANSSSAYTENKTIYWLLGAGLFGASFLSFWIQKKNYVFHLPLMAVLALVPTFVFDKALVSNEFSFSYGWAFALVAFVVALLGYVFSSGIMYMTRKAEKDQKPFLHTVYAGLLLALIVYFLFFFYSNGGVLILTVYLIIGYLLSSEHQPLSIGPLLFALGIFPILWGPEPEQVLDVSQGSNLFALLLGLTSVVLYEVQAEGKRSASFSFLIALLFGGFTYVIWWLGTQKPDLGGSDAIVASLLGVGLGALFTPKRQGASVLMATVLTVSVCTSFFTDSKAVMKDEKAVSKTHGSEEKAAEKEVKTFPLDSLNGNFIFDEKVAEISFELGPKGGRTKGLITNISGNLELDTKQKKGIVNVEMKVSNLSTFNSYRDESLMEPGYFNAATFPTMTYKARLFSKEGEKYYLNGEFNMLGKRKEVRVELRYLGEQEVKGKRYPVLSGSGTIDRTLFGMKPDSKEGNIVDFTLYIPLLEK
jgi:polyisoprenoid-binding protein YceI